MTVEVRPDLSDQWFTVEQLDERTYAISEYGHWEQVHAYVAIGGRRAALIDSGLGIGDIKTIVQRITTLPVTVVTTHVHWDHIGGHDGFDDIAVHRDDADWLRDGIPVPLETLRADLTREPPTKPPPAGFDPAAWRPYQGEPTRVLADGDELGLGGRTLRVVHTPGHSPGHIALHDRGSGLLFTGDLVYRGCLYAFYPSTDPAQFARSVHRLRQLEDVKVLAPAHGALPLARAFLDRVGGAFDQLQRRGQLHHSSGVHDFDDGLSIKL